MRAITLTPADSFFFKGHMVTEMGSPSQWSSLFPPRPNTVYGALRSAYIHKHSTFDDFYKERHMEVKKWMGSPKQFGAFQQQAVFIKRGDDILLPVPMDYHIKRAIHNEEDILRAVPLKLTDNTVLSNMDLRFTLMEEGSSELEGKLVDHIGNYVTMSEWSSAVMEQNEIAHIHSLKNIIGTYLKTGIKIDHSSKRAEDSHFFEMNMMNMQKDCSLVSLCATSPDFSDVPFVSLGAENRPWFVQQNRLEWSLWSPNQLKVLEDRLTSTEIARIILLTPLVLPDNSPLMNGTQQSNWKWELMSGVNVELITWVTGRSELYGGWDMARKRPKLRAQMLPAGTVFYVRVQQEDISKIVDAANGFTLFPGETDGRDKEGFGFAVIAGTTQKINF